MIVIHILWQLYLQSNHYFKVISIIWKRSNNSPTESASISATQQSSILPFIPSKQRTSALIDIPIVDSTCEPTYNRTLH